MKQKYKKILLILILITIFGLIYILNNKTMLVSDDYPYHFLFEGRTPNNNTRLISNPLEIVTSMKNHWKLWGGRVTVHYLLQLTFMLGTNIFNIINSIMFILLGILVYKHINNTKEIKLTLIIFIYAILFLLIPQPGSTIIWKSGSANYLWSSVLILCMTLIYKKHYDNNNNIKNNPQNAILIFIYGLIVGCCNENTGCALIIAQILFILLYKVKYKKIPLWAITGLIGTIISYIILIIAPGNYIRADLMYQEIDYSLEGMFKKFLILTNLSYTYMKIVLILTTITLVIIYNKKDNFQKIVNKYAVQVIFLIFTLASIYSLLLSPAYPERCWFFAFIYLLIITGINLNYLDNKNDTIKKILIIFVIIISLCSISEYSEAYYNIDQSYIELKEQLTEIETQIHEGKKDIVVHATYNHTGKYNAFTDNGYLTSTKESWFNKWMAKYYNVDSIIAID